MSVKSTVPSTRKPHCGPHPLLCILDGTHRPVPVQDHLHQIESQAAASGAPASGPLGPVKGIKEMGQGYLRDPGPGVLHRQGGTAVPETAPHPDLRILRRVEGGVGQQVPHRPAQQGGSAGSSFTVFPCALSRGPRLGPPPSGSGSSRA